jgi:hypothetical protein
METFQQTMTKCGMHESLQKFTVDAENVEINPLLVACNFSFKNLTSLIISSDCNSLCQTSGLTDNDIDLLSTAMPCLETLNLGSAPCISLSQITFKSLYTLSRRCTRLNDLLIHFNPALFVTKCRKLESWDVALGISDVNTSLDLCSVTELYAGEIPLPEQSHACSILALGLLRVFPCLEEVVYENEDWAGVDFLVGVFRRMGCLGKG